MKEIWKDIKGFEGAYQVSSYGRIKSLRREIEYKDGRHFWKEEKIISCSIDNSTGYLQVNLCTNGKHKKERVHRLVAQAFFAKPKSI